MSAVEEPRATRAAGIGPAQGPGGDPGADPPSAQDATAPRRRGTEKPTRLSVNISKATAEALREVSGDKDVPITEAVRRLIGYGIVVYRVVREGGEVLVRRGDRTERLVLLD